MYPVSRSTCQRSAGVICSSLRPPPLMPPTPPSSEPASARRQAMTWRMDEASEGDGSKTVNGILSGQTHLRENSSSVWWTSSDTSHAQRDWIHPVPSASPTMHLIKCTLQYARRSLSLIEALSAADTVLLYACIRNYACTHLEEIRQAQIPNPTHVP